MRTRSQAQDLPVINHFHMALNCGSGIPKLERIAWACSLYITMLAGTLFWHPRHSFTKESGWAFWKFLLGLPGAILRNSCLRAPPKTSRDDLPGFSGQSPGRLWDRLIGKSGWGILNLYYSKPEYSIYSSWERIATQEQCLGKGIRSPEKYNSLTNNC